MIGRRLLLSSRPPSRSFPGRHVHPAGKVEGDIFPTPCTPVSALLRPLQLAFLLCPFNFLVLRLLYPNPRAISLPLMSSPLLMSLQVQHLRPLSPPASLQPSVSFLFPISLLPSPLSLPLLFSSSLVFPFLSPFTRLSLPHFHLHPCAVLQGMRSVWSRHLEVPKLTSPPARAAINLFPSSHPFLDPFFNPPLSPCLSSPWIDKMLDDSRQHR